MESLWVDLVDFPKIESVADLVEEIWEAWVRSRHWFWWVDQ